MCGFFGIIYKDEEENLGNILFNAGVRLSYRGYDTSGVAVINSRNEYLIKKDVGRIEEVGEKYGFKKLKGKRGIIQLRWATFGVPSKNNAQPHKDCKGELIGAHNGNIINTPLLRFRLIEAGHKFNGENDGEVILHIVEDYKNLKNDMIDAILLAIKELEGDYAFIITDIKEDRMFAVKKGSSLFFGKGTNFTCVSSDLASILDHTKEILILNDGEMIEFGSDYYILRDTKNGNEIKRKITKTDIDIEKAEKGNFPHFMIKEIYESPEKVSNLIGLLSTNVVYEESVDLINSARNIYITGAGTSYHASLLGTYYFSTIADRLLNISFASDFGVFFSSIIEDDDVLIAVSQSGETKDVKNVCDIFRKKTKGKIISVVNNIGSTIALNSDIVLPIVSDIEISVPATKTFINQSVLFLYLSVLSAKKRLKKFPNIYFEEIPEIIKKTIKISEEYSEEVLKHIKDYKEFYILGYGLTYPAALEASLKIKEVVYVHSEGMYSGEFKHGPLSIVEKDYPVFFISNKEDKFFTLSHINEVKTRLGKIITIAPEDKELRNESDLFVPLPTDNKFLVPICGTVFFQILAYKFCVSKGIDPDYPKNISKTITVD